MKTAAHITETERLQRIGELLSKGVTLMLAAEANEQQRLGSGDAVPPQRTQDGTTPTAGVPDDVPVVKPVAVPVVDFLKRVGSASPREIQVHFGFSRRTASRRLNQLQDAGVIVRNGHTRDVRYRIAAGADDVRPEATHTRGPSG